MRRRRPPTRSLALFVVTALAGCATPPESDPGAGSIRVATFNCSLHRPTTSRLTTDLEAGDAQARKVAAIIQRVRPDVLLLNEFDFDPDGRALRRFVADYLARPAQGGEPIGYDHVFVAAVNTGEPSGLDLDGDGAIAGPGDAWGYGRHPGQYGMIVLSRFPIDRSAARTFRDLRWVTMPGAAIPPGHWPREVVDQLRLSSKSHWDVPITLPDGRVLHLLASHPTPPVFDGPEDRNGRHNHDEIRFWAEYLRPDTAGWIVDDQGRPGGLDADELFVICGDLNADPVDGDSFSAAIRQLLDHERVAATTVPCSAGAVEAAHEQAGANRTQRGDPAHDTGDFADANGPGNLRIDYVLPARSLSVVRAGVFWPRRGEQGADWLDASDHRLVWVELR